MTVSYAPDRGLGVRLWASPYLLLVATVLLWSGNVIVGRMARADVPPITLTFWRWTLALVILLPFAWRRLAADLPELRRRWKAVVLLSFFGIACYNAMAYHGLAMTTAVNGGLLQSAMSPIVLLGAFLLFRERPTGMQILGVVVSVLGVLTVVAQGDPHVLARFRLNAGDLWVLAGVTTYAIYAVLLRIRPQTHPFSLLAAIFSVGALMLLPFYVAEMATGHFIRPTVTAAGCIAYVSLFPSLIAYLMFNRGVELIGAGRAGQFIHLMPVFSAVLAVVLLGERLHPYHFLGASLIGAGIAIASRRRKAA